MLFKIKKKLFLKASGRRRMKREKVVIQEELRLGNKSSVMVNIFIGEYFYFYFF